MRRSIPTEGGSTAARPNRDIAFSSHRTAAIASTVRLLVAYHAGYFTNNGELSAQHVLIQLFMGHFPSEATSRHRSQIRVAVELLTNSISIIEQLGRKSCAAEDVIEKQT
jgi:hypothetical protein